MRMTMKRMTTTMCGTQITRMSSGSRGKIRWWSCSLTSCHLFLLYSFFSHILPFPFYFFVLSLPPFFNLFVSFFLSLILFFLSHSLTLSLPLSLSIYLSICLSHSLSLSHTYKHKLLPPYFVPSISFSPLSSLQPTSYEPEGPMGRLLRAVNESDFPPGMSDSE